MSDLAAPVNVHPLIRFGRYTLLALGIIYGIFHQHRLSAKEAKVREIEAKEKLIRDVKLAEEKRKRVLAEQRAIDVLSGKTI